MQVEHQSITHNNYRYNSVRFDFLGRWLAQTTQYYCCYVTGSVLSILNTNVVCSNVNEVVLLTWTFVQTSPNDFRLFLSVLFRCKPVLCEHQSRKLMLSTGTCWQPHGVIRIFITMVPRAKLVLNVRNERWRDGFMRTSTSQTNARNPVLLLRWRHFLIVRLVFVWHFFQRL